MTALLWLSMGSGGVGSPRLRTCSLRQQRKRTPPVKALEFNPWHWSGQDQLHEGFFTELGIGISGTQPKNLRKIAARWREYAAYLRVGSQLGSATRRILAGLLLILGVMGIGTALDHPLARTIASVIGILALLAAAATTWLGGFAQEVAKLAEARAESGRLSLKERKNQLVDLLRTLDSSILVVVDDVDRLTPPQIRLLFQLVKANADFPRLVYLLLFQRDKVESALGEGDASEGRQYLEKIVQVAFDVPTVERTRIEKVLGIGQVSF